MKIKRYIVTFLILLVILPIESGYSNNKNIITLNSLSYTKEKKLKKLRKDIRKSIFVIRSKRKIIEMPSLTFYKYIVKKRDNFWKVLSRTSLDMDTLISVNCLDSPKDLFPGKILFIPNMRGIIASGKNKKFILKNLKQNRVGIKYLLKINKITNLNKKYIFIPCGKISSMERSLFLGTGFAPPLKKGRRSSGFGRRRNPFNHRRIQFHPGIDFACSVGTRVYSTRGGTVEFVGYSGGYGKLVIIVHSGGYKSYYGHLSKIKVKKGMKVKAGRVIAFSGNTGLSTGPHLHFEIRKHNRPINPVILIHNLAH